MSPSARRTSSTPSPGFLALHENAAPPRRVDCRDFPGGTASPITSPAPCASAHKSAAQCSRKARTSWQGGMERQVEGAGNSVPCRGWGNRGNLHARSVCLFAQCVVDCGSTYLQYAFALSPNLAQRCCAAQARRLPWFSQPRQEPEVPGPPPSLRAVLSE